MTSKQPPLVFVFVSHRTHVVFVVCRFSAPLLFICLCARSFFCSKNGGAPRVPPISFQGEDEEAEKQKRDDGEERQEAEERTEERKQDEERRQRSRRVEEK